MKFILLFTISLVSILPHTVLSYDGDEIDPFNGCPRGFKGRCDCGNDTYRYWHNDQEQYVVNCTNTNLKDTDILELLPIQTQVLIFNGNNVPNLDWNLFGLWNEHKALEVVDLSNNRIREISGKTFHKVKYVKRLVLDHNDLIISGPSLHQRVLSNFENLEGLHLTNAFTETVDSKWYLRDLKSIFLNSNMTKLTTLHLEQNEIWSIEDDDLFCALPSLTHLYLGDNQLQSVDFSLNCLKQLQYLDLEYNKIKRLSKKTLDKFDKVFLTEDPEDDSKKINLKENPFVCDCNLLNFYHWLRETNTSLFHKEDLRCYEGIPSSNAGKRILNVELFSCPEEPKSVSEGGSSPVTNALLLILIVLVVVVGALVVHYNRDQLKDGIKPLVDKFQKSMQYRTIDKEEGGSGEPPEVNV